MCLICSSTAPPPPHPLCSVGKLIVKAGKMRVLITRPVFDSERSLQCRRKISILLVIKQMAYKKNIAVGAVPAPEARQTDAVKHLITSL